MEFELTVEVSYYLAGRWRNPFKTEPEKREDMLIRDRHPAAPPLNQIALLAQTSLVTMWKHFPPIAEIAPFVTRSQQYHLSSDFYTTVQENDKVKMISSVLKVGSSSVDCLTKFINSSGKQVGYVISKIVSIRDNKSALIPSDSQVRLIQTPFPKELKFTDVRFQFDLASGKCDYVHHIQVRSSDLDLWLHLNQSRYPLFAMDALDAALVANSSQLWAKDVLQVRQGLVESCHNIPWSRVFAQHDGQIKLRDNVEVRLKVVSKEKAVEFLILTSEGASQSVAAKLKCWFPEKVKSSL
jgi:acyl-CoA thioesterase FadM